MTIDAIASSHYKNMRHYLEQKPNSRCTATEVRTSSKFNALFIFHHLKLVSESTQIARLFPIMTLSKNLLILYT
jgi:hypothetical protein